MGLTKEQQDIIEKAALLHGQANYYTGSLSECTQKDTQGWVESDFIAGATFALSSPDLIRPVLEEFIAWGNEKELNCDKTGVWYTRQGYGSSVLAADDAELVTIFLKDKQKEDEQQAGRPR